MPLRPRRKLSATFFLCRQERIVRLFGRKAYSPEPDRKDLTRKLREAETRYLEVLRRELANLIMEANPDLMVRAYDRARIWEHETAGNPERLQADEQALVAKVPVFEDFDRIGTRHFVPYADRHDALTDDDLVEAYLELSRTLVFLRNRQQPDVGRRRLLHDERDYKVLLDTVRRAKDRHFRGRMDEAMQRAHAYRQGFGASKGDIFAGMRETYSDEEFEVFALPYGPTPENETGIVLKKTDEYGVLATFHHDDGRIIESRYRTDRQFAARIPLN